MSKNFRNRKRKHNKKLPARYTLLIMTAVCFVTMLLSLTLNISGGPLKTAAGYVFIPMQKGINSFGIHISDKITEIRTLKNVKAENKKLKADTSGQKLFSLYLILIHILAHEASLYIIRAGHLSGLSRY